MDHQQLDRYLSDKRINLYEIMSSIAALADDLLGSSAIRRLCRISFLQTCFCLAAFLWFEFRIAGPDLLSDFLGNGMAVKLDSVEKTYLFTNWPWLLANYSPDGGTTFNVSGLFVDLAILVAAITFVFSTISSISILFSLNLISRMAQPIRIRTIGLRLAIAFLFSLACDFIALVLVAGAILIGGKSVGLYVREYFDASVAGNWLAYGVKIERRTEKENVGVAFNLGTSAINFDDFNTVPPAPNGSVMRWLLPEPLIANDAIKLCNNYNLQPNCAGHLRALFLKSFHPPASLLAQTAAGLPYALGWLSCGQEVWTALPGIGEGASEATRLAFPFAAAIGAMALSKALIVPVLIAIYLSNYGILKLAKYTARSSERGLSIVALNAATLCATPPIVAMTLIFVAKNMFLCG
jgi:hypothetical protein